MRNRIITNSRRAIKKTILRFLSLMIMSFLGVFVFVGLLSTAPSMINTLDEYLDKHNSYDIRLVSTLGFTDDDVIDLKNIDGIEHVEGSIYKDTLVNINTTDFVMRVESLPTKINSLSIIKGRLPQNNEEIVVEQKLLDTYNLHLNDEIIFNEGEFANSEFTIVGVIVSPLYYNSVGISSSRGTTNLGTGTINFYAFVSFESFNENYYNTLYITADGALEEVTSSNEYLEIINKIKNNIADIKGKRETLRFNYVYNEISQKINEEELKIQKELTINEKKLESAKNELITYETNLNNVLQKLKINKEELETFKNELDNNLAIYEENLKTNNIKESELDDKIIDLENKIVEITNALKDNPSDTLEYGDYQRKLQELNKNLETLILLKETQNALSNAMEEYNQNQANYDEAYEIYQSQYNLYQDNLKAYKLSLAKFTEASKKAKDKIATAREELDSIEVCKWYMYDRSDYLTYTEYIDDTNSISNLATIFPIVFFAVAILVSLISMNRMVEADRSEIGTLKSLGFRNYQIMTKYLLFASLATLLGGFFGFFLGNCIIPNLIYNIYKILFDLPSLSLVWNFKIALLGFGITFICTCGTTMFTVLKVLKEKPANLMRGKAPKKGKRVFLEHIGFIWDSLKFSSKVTIRNLFRYKKRVIVTIVGIAGCTALILCGFGIKDAIVNLSDMQYGKIFTFDAMAFVNNLHDDDKNIFNQDEIQDYLFAGNISATLNKTSIKLFVVSDPFSLENYVSLKDTNDKKITLIDNEVVITDKLADLKKIKVGDSIDVVDTTGNSFTFKVGAITKNYVEHYVYLTKNTFEDAGGIYEENIVYYHTKDLNSKEEEKLTSKLLKNASIINVTNVHTLKESLSNMLKSLDKVVFILIFLASSLSFVVLYNLSNINIEERKREIATLKVLGFYHREVDNYITKENIILTIIGIVIGLIIGYFLTFRVIASVEIEKARFIRNISIYSYMYAIMISCLFTIIVNIVTHFSLKRIDMISSLKSVE